MGKGPKKKVLLHCHDVIGKWRESWCAWADIWLEFHVKKKKMMLAPCVMGMMDAVHDREYWHKSDLYEDDIAFAKLAGESIKQKGYYIELGEDEDSASDCIVVGEDFVTRNNTEPVLIEYMKAHGVKIDRVKFVWIKPSIICQGISL